MLIDFGALSRDVSKATRALGTAGEVKAHYTAPDQAIRNATPDPTTDVYSVGAVLYRALMGHAPEDGTHRLSEIGSGGTDPYKPMAAHRPAPVSPALAEAVDASLKVRKAERPPSIAALRERLSWEDAAPGASAPPPKTRMAPVEVLSPRPIAPAPSRPGAPPVSGPVPVTSLPVAPLPVPGAVGAAAPTPDPTGPGAVLPSSPGPSHPARAHAVPSVAPRPGPSRLISPPARRPRQGLAPVWSSRRRGAGRGRPRTPVGRERAGRSPPLIPANAPPRGPPRPISSDAAAWPATRTTPTG